MCPFLNTTFVNDLFCPRAINTYFCGFIDVHEVVIGLNAAGSAKHSPFYGICHHAILTLQLHVLRTPIFLMVFITR